MSHLLKAVATLSLKPGVKVNMRLSKIVLEITTVLTLVYLQLHVCDPYKNNFADPHADNLELL